MWVVMCATLSCGPDEQHRDLRAVAEVGQQLGVPGVRVSRPPHRRLVERRGGQGVDAARQRRPRGGANRGHRQLAALGAHLAVGRRLDRLGYLVDEDPPRPRIVAREIGVERKLESARGELPPQRGPRPEDHGTAVLIDAGSLSALSATSGPTPAGSPIVMATRGRVMRSPPAERAGRPPRTSRTS